MAEKFLPTFFLPAVQAFLYPGRREDRLRDAFSPRGLADAFGRLRGAVAGGTGIAGLKTEKALGF